MKDTLSFRGAAFYDKTPFEVERIVASAFQVETLTPSQPHSELEEIVALWRATGRFVG